MSIQPSGAVNATPRARMRFFVQKIAGRMELNNFDLNGFGTSIWGSLQPITTQNVAVHGPEPYLAFQIRGCS